jgi:hypothetical protein
MAPARRPATPSRTPLAYAVAPVRLVGDLVLGLAYTAHELPYLVQDLRALVNELTRLANGADDGALTDLVAELARAARTDGELSRLLDGAAELAAARAARERAALTATEDAAGGSAGMVDLT